MRRDNEYIDIFNIPDYTYTDVVFRTTNRKWYQRLWVLVSNPFCYLFKGYIRF